MNLKSARIIVTGQVQGVGYRYFCRHHAREHGLVGWVRNLPDGSVGLQVEGEANALERFIAELQRGPHSAVVAAVNVTFGDHAGTFHLFEIIG